MVFVSIQKKVAVAVGIGAFLILFSCDLPSTPGVSAPEDGTAGGEVSESANDLFKADSTKPNRVELNTNDRSYIKPRGVTLWTTPYEEAASFTPVEARFKKISGYAQTGYGLVFCAQRQGSYGMCLLAVLITVNGDYAIGKVVNGEYKNIQWWQPTGKIAKGYNRENTLKVTRNGVTGEFTLYINNVQECVFRDETEPKLENGKSGYAAVISPHEVFPLNSVRIVFEKL